MAQAALEMSRTTDARAARILARSLFRDMRSNGYATQQILTLATELIDLVTRDMRGEGEEAPEANDVGLKIVSRS